MSPPSEVPRPSSPRGLPVVLSAPSGTGKSTIACRLTEQSPSTCLSISCTTRAPRPGEKEGEHYFFTTFDEFKRKIEAGEFLEWAIVHGHYYGTPLKALETQLDRGRDVILTIDPQGALSVKRIYPGGVFIFVVPPSWDVLMKRLYKRATDDQKSMDIRIANARKELAYLGHYDYLVVNDDLDTAVRQVSAIISAEHMKTSRVDQRSLSILE
jgi:guanylate kinase